MQRTSKLLGIVATIVAAFGAITAAAGAAEPQFTTSAGATLSGPQKNENKYTITGQALTCVERTFHGEAPSEVFTELAVGISVSGCIAEPLGLEMTITGYGAPGEANKCWYVFHANGGADLECDGSGEVTATIFTCQVNIKGQTLGSGVTYMNGTSGGNADLTVSLNLEGIETTHTDGFLCPFGSGGLSKVGIYEGEVTFSASVKGEAVDVSWEE